MKPEFHNYCLSHITILLNIITKNAQTYLFSNSLNRINIVIIKTRWQNEWFTRANQH